MAVTPAADNSGIVIAAMNSADARRSKMVQEPARNLMILYQKTSLLHCNDDHAEFTHLPRRFDAAQYDFRLVPVTNEAHFPRVVTGTAEDISWNRT